MCVCDYERCLCLLHASQHVVEIKKGCLDDYILSNALSLPLPPLSPFCLSSLRCVNLPPPPPPPPPLSVSLSVWHLSVYPSLFLSFPKSLSLCPSPYLSVSLSTCLPSPPSPSLPPSPPSSAHDSPALHHHRDEDDLPPLPQPLMWPRRRLLLHRGIRPLVGGTTSCPAALFHFHFLSNPSDVPKLVRGIEMRLDIRLDIRLH